MEIIYIFIRLRHASSSDMMICLVQILDRIPLCFFDDETGNAVTENGDFFLDKIDGLG